MERSKILLSKNVKKKIDKAVRSAPRLAVSEKPVKATPEKKTSNSTKGISKRTTPGEPYAESVPSTPHKEGVRWKKTLTKQTKENNKIFRRKNVKQHPKGKMGKLFKGR